MDARLIDGVALYNHRRFFEAHEVLEALWRDTTEPRAKKFYQGLIQAAVACYHWSKHNPAGALTLAHSSSRYLRNYTPEFLGLDVEGFLGRYTELFAWLRRHRLRYDARLVPPLRWLRGQTP